MSIGRSPKWPVVFYATGWLLAAFIAAGAVVVAVRGASDSDPPRRAGVERPADAINTSCVVRRDTGRVTPSALGVMQPPTLGPPSRPAAPGIHTRPIPSTALVGALRRGFIVVQYRPSLRPALVRRLRQEFGSGDPPTIVAPDATGMRFAVAVTAWSRLLGCASASEDTLTAGQEFRRRYAGTGPDVRP